MKVSFEKQVISLSQTRYIKQLLSTWGYSECKPIETPCDYNKKLSAMNQLEYSKLIGSLMYVMSCTRPDIAFTIGMLSRFTSNPSNEHWDALTRLMRYLKGTVSLGLTLTLSPLTIIGYNDSGWAGCPIDRRSTSGYCIFLGNNLIS
ncbi:hypothetical protein CFOL_v3_31798 [Cephalotus follicularis]|uniref:RVT_2 domain-containing protein n=1 Tax=Cephalotus follicularis TaxID=3775 RepID=A0A1Q3D7G3_CEPFO|nr:hypothetical protein CFOL_v3_31798 [Cephalotus follicularis]